MNPETIKDYIKDQIEKEWFGDSDKIFFTEAYIKNNTAMIQNKFTLDKRYLEGMFRNGKNIKQSIFPQSDNKDHVLYQFQQNNSDYLNNIYNSVVVLSKMKNSILINTTGKICTKSYIGSERKQVETSYNYNDVIEDKRIIDHDIFVSIIYPAFNVHLSPIITVFIVDKEKHNMILDQVKAFDPVVILDYIFETEDMEMSDSLLKPIWSSLYKDIGYSCDEIIYPPHYVKNSNISKLLMPNLKEK